MTILDSILNLKVMGTAYKDLFKLYDLIQCGDVGSVERFLSENEIDTNQILPCKGIGVLHLAVGIEDVEKSKRCTELLLRTGSDPNLCNEDGLTPVHIAAIWGHVDNLKLMIGCGGDPSCRDIDGHSAFDYAAREQQWNVYDYLHNVVDQLDDSSGSPCAYSLDLDKILLTTDQMVAEYYPVPDNRTYNATAYRKSEMVREWCDKTSLVMNKLYPTILGETFSIDNGLAWRTINFTNNMTFDLSTNESTNKSELNETNNTFKTCVSKVTPNDVEISGIQRLEITSDESKDTNPKNVSNPDLPKQRMSVYENFSLPGSPNSITHRNYNSKTSLKKNNSKETSSSELRLLTFESSQSDDYSEELDNALTVAQNKTNEWLYSSKRSDNLTDVKANNTRRSSASSGVSSNFSGGSIVLANVHEEYKYEDKEEDVVLIEKRLLVTSVVLPVDDSIDSPDQSIVSVASSMPASVEYDVNTLRAELLRLGFTPGPIQDHTKSLYLKKLQTLKKNTVDASHHHHPVASNNTKKRKTYSIELEKSLRTDDWMKNLSPYNDLEIKARADFSDPNRKWREGTTKTSFTYLLLDPRLTNNLPVTAGKQNSHLSWATFINSIFYVGKGKRSRPYSHLYQALTLWKRDFKTSKDKKVQHILDIWSDKVGVVCLHIFQNVIPAEAYTYEAAMIDVIGVQNLENLKVGNYYGAVASWPLKERRMLGLYLLYKAMLIFLSEGERQLRPDDID